MRIYEIEISRGFEPCARFTLRSSKLKKNYLPAKPWHKIQGSENINKNSFLTCEANKYIFPNPLPPTPPSTRSNNNHHDTTHSLVMCTKADARNCKDDEMRPYGLWCAASLGRLFFYSVYISKSSASEAMYSSCTYAVYMVYVEKNQKHFYRLLYGTFGNATKEGEENSRAIVFHRKMFLCDSNAFHIDTLLVTTPSIIYV